MWGKVSVRLLWLVKCSLVLAFSASDDLLLFAPPLHSDEALLLALVQYSVDVRDDVLQVSLRRQVVVFLHFTLSGQELQGAVVDAEADVLDLDNDGGLDHISGAESLLVLLVREDVLASDHGLGRSVLARLGRGEASHAARERILEHDERAWLHATGFLEFGGEGTRNSLFKIVITHSFFNPR